MMGDMRTPGAPLTAKGRPSERHASALVRSEEYAHHLFLIGGAPNVGKTTLVTHLLHILNHYVPGSADIAKKATTKRPRGLAEDPGLEYVDLNEFLTLDRTGSFFYQGRFADARYGVRKNEIDLTDKDRFLVTASDEAFVEMLLKARNEGIPTVPILLTTSTEALRSRAIAERPAEENAVRLPMLGRLTAAFETNAILAKYIIDTTTLRDLLSGSSLDIGESEAAARKLAYSSMRAKIDQLVAIVNHERSYKPTSEAAEVSPARYIHTYFNDALKGLFGKSIRDVITEGRAVFRHDSPSMLNLEQQGYGVQLLANRIAGFGTNRIEWNEGGLLCIEYTHTASALSGYRRSMVEHDKTLEQDIVFAMFQNALDHKGYKARNSISFRLTDRLSHGHDELARATQPVYTLQVSFTNGESRSGY